VWSGLARESGSGNAEPEDVDNFQRPCACLTKLEGQEKPWNQNEMGLAE
jgi:hypothetical protein